MSANDSARSVNRQVREILSGLLDTSAAFRRWLEVQADDRTYVNGDPCGCPLHEFIDDELRRLDVRVDLLQITQDEVEWQAYATSTKQALPLSEWAAEFSTFDNDMSNEGIVMITSKKALDWLDAVEDRK